uniref:DUF559 domain-containing protein n=1 Tax=viral metagenome TaxID=1070528 RepID=A0A6H1ZDK0_9ZZZZ
MALIPNKRKAIYYVRKFARRLKKKQTLHEKKFALLLKKMDIKFFLQKFFKTKAKSGDRYYIVDFYLPDKKIVVEINGRHHQNEDQKKLDTLRTRRLLRLDSIDRVVRLSNDTVNTLSIIFGDDI